jgi:hypothetical protein
LCNKASADLSRWFFRNYPFSKQYYHSKMRSYKERKQDKFRAIKMQARTLLFSDGKFGLPGLQQV